jgi:hypothetical protein
LYLACGAPLHELFVEQVPIAVDFVEMLPARRVRGVAS